MKTRVAISLAVLSFAAGAISQEYSEPSNFNITEALLENGVSVSAIPQLQELENEKRSFSDPCAIACSSLKLLFGSQLLSSGADYDAFTTAYWSTQAASVDPYCIFKPMKALDVSTVAGPYQNVIPGYGEANLAKLKSVAKKYDPTAVFQKLQPGGYKLEGAPYGESIA